MGTLFSGNNAKKSKQNKIPEKQKQSTVQVTDKDRAVLDLKNARDRLKKFKKKLESNSEKLRLQARELLQQNHKQRALLLLKLRKYKEKELENVDAQLLNVFKMLEDIEWESQNMEILKALKSGTDALNKIHEEMSVEDVENLLADTNEAIEVENAINQLLIGQLTQLEDAELMEELDSIMASVAGDTVAEGSVYVDLPAVPTHQPVALPTAPDSPVGEDAHMNDIKRVAIPS